MTHTVIGFFRNSSDAYNAADILRERGFDINNVDVTAGYGTDEYRSDRDKDEKSGKIGNFFRSLFSDDKERNDIDRYTRAAKDNSIVTVHASSVDEAERASDILDSCGAIDIDDGGSFAESEKAGADYELRGSRMTNMDDRDITDPDLELDRSSRMGSGKDYDMNNESSGTAFDRNVGDKDFELTDIDRDPDKARFTSDKDGRTSDASIPVIEEEVNVGKREVKRGGVRVRSRIIERPVEETLRLREERVHVERTPADRAATDAELENFQEDTIEVHEYSEEPLVSKRSRVVEEVKVGKEVHERNETVSEKARKTQVDIENLEDEETRKKR